MKLYKMIEIYLKHDNMYTFGVIIAFIGINNHVNSCINSMLLPIVNGLDYTCSLSTRQSVQSLKTQECVSKTFPNSKI